MRMLCRTIVLPIIAVFIAFCPKAYALELELPENVKIIEEDAFFGDTSLDEVILPDGITTIESGAFAYSSIEIINLPASLVYIADDAFEGVNDLLVDAEQGTYAYEWADRNGFITHSSPLKDFSFEAIDDLTCKIVNYHGEGGKVIIPESDGQERTVTVIGTNAFYNCEELEQIEIPSNVKTIENYAFANCGGITSITLHEGLESIGDRAFADCTSLLSMKVPDSVTSIGTSFILGDLAMTDLEFGGGVKELYVYNTRISGRSEDQPALETLVIGEGVESLGSYAFACSGSTYFNDEFYNCSYPNLRNITLPESLTLIGEGAFKNATSLEEIELPSRLELIGHFAFCDCTALRTVNIPKTVTAIGNHAFSRCGMLENIVLPEGLLKTIGDYAFYDCDAFTNTEIPESVESIGGYAFANCGGITSITLHEGLESIGDRAFADCISLLSMKVPDSVTSIGTSFILGDLAITDLEFGGGVKELYVYNTRISGRSEDQPALETLVIGEGVESLGSYAFACSGSTYFNDEFYNCSYPNLRNITLPESLTLIGEGAFKNATSLEEIELPSKLELIGHFAFCDCTALRTVNIPKTVTAIGNHAFSRCGMLKNIVLPEGLLKTIGNYAFYDCDAFTNTEIPESVESIGGYAFANCGGITSITLHEGLESIGDRAFADCTALLSMKVPDSVTSIGTSFILGDLSMTDLEFGGGVKELYVYNTRISGRSEDQPALETLVIGEGVKSLGSYAFACSGSTYFNDEFYNCSYPNLRNITLPESLTLIGEGAFKNATSLEEIELPSKLGMIGKFTFCDCTALRTVNIPDAVATIGNYAFSNCIKLENIVFPEWLEDIGDYAFYNCDTFTYMDIPANVESIGHYAFAHCDSIMTIILQEGLKSIGNRAFSDCISLLGIAVPDSVTSIGTSFILGDLAMTYLKFGGGVKELYVYNTRISGRSEDQPALETLIIGEGVESLGSYTFACSDKTYFNDELYNCSYPNLKNITLPESLASIGEGAFMRAVSLASIDISKAKTIGNGVFSECENLTTVILPDEIKGIPDYLFFNCFKLENVNITNSIERIGNYAFHNCTSLPPVDFTRMPNLWKIGDSAFYNCDQLTTVNLDCIQIIGSDAFNHCDSITTITLSETTTREIGSGAFAQCPLLQSLKIPSTVMSVGSYIINGDVGLTTLTINGGLQVNNSQYHIGGAEECNLTSLFIGGNITSIGNGAFADWKTLTTVLLPPNLTSIGSWAFSGCSNVLGYLTLPTGLTELGRGAFQDCPNWVGYSIVIPYNVTGLPGYAFAGCSKLSTIVMSSKAEWIDTSAFAGCSDSVELVIPSGSAVSQWCEENHREGDSWNYRTYSNDSTYYDTSVHTVTAAPRNISVISDTYKENDPYRITFTVDDDIQAVNIYVIRGTAAMTHLDTFYSTSDGVTVTEEEGVYYWTIDFSPGTAGVVGDNYDVIFRLETVAWNQRNTGIHTDTGYVKIIPAEMVEPTVELLIEDAELISYKATKVNLKLKISQPDTVDETSSVSFKYLENPYILIELPEGIESCVFSQVMGGYRCETNTDRSYKLYLTGLHNKYGTATVSCELKYDILSDEFGGYNTETLSLTVKADNGYERETYESSIVFGIELLGLNEDEIPIKYFKHLNRPEYHENPLDDVIISSIIYYELSNPFPLKANGHGFAEEVLNWLNAAPEAYRKVYLYSFYGYKRNFMNSEDQGYYEPASNTLYMNIGTYEYDINWPSELLATTKLATFFHESGHAMDWNSKGTNSASITGDHAEQIAQAVNVDVRTWVLSRIDEFRADPNNGNITDEEALEISDAIFDVRNKNTTVVPSESIHSIEELYSAVITVADPVGLKSAYISDYKRIVEFCIRYLATEIINSTLNYNDPIYRKFSDSCMFPDMIGAATNNVIHGVFTFNSHPTSYWEQENSLQREAWAEYYSSVVMRSVIPELYSKNLEAFPCTCNYLEQVVFPEMLSIYSDGY